MLAKFYYVRSRSTPQSPHSPQLVAIAGRGEEQPNSRRNYSASALATASCPLLQPRHHQSEQQLSKRRCIYASTGSAANIMMDRESLSEWAKDKPLSILQLDPADRAVLRIAGESQYMFRN
ncbi:hypothetical protein ACLKA7_013002 [Drosophila subpalustris]